MTTQRLEAFSDGVFAVAITLLALDVRLPVLPASATDEELYRAVLALAPKLVTYFLTFVLVGMFWIAHHRVFAAIRRVDRAMLWLNLILLLWICLVPLSAAALSAHPYTRTGVTVYGLNVICIGISLFSVWHHACRKKLLHPQTDPGFIRLSYYRTMVGTPVYAVAVAVSFWSPKVSCVIFFFALIMYLVPGQVDRYFTKTNSDEPVA